MYRIFGIAFWVLALVPHSTLYAQSLTKCKCELAIDNSFQIAPMTVGQDTDIGVPPLYENDNATTPAMQLPFSFCFYGKSYDSVFISNNGIISFTQAIHDFIDSTQKFPLGYDTAIIAPFYADANTLHNSGLVYYKITSTYMAVIWDSVRYVGTDVDGWNTFQLIITNGTDPIVPDGNNVAFCYPVMQWACSDASGGFSGYGGTPAFVGINKGDGVNYAQISSFSMPGTAYYGAYSPYNGVDWLDFTSFTFNTCVTGNIIAPVIFNDRPACNTLYICPCDTTTTEAALGAHDSSLIQPCDTVSLTAAFICAMPGQNAVMSYSCEGPLNIYSVDTSTVNFIDSMTIQVIPVYTDTGTQVLTITATDTVSHLQSTVTYTLVVTTNCLNPPPPPTAITQTLNETGFSVYPNPAGKNLGIQYDNVTGNATVRILDIMGSEMLNTRLGPGKQDIDVASLARGLYFVQLFRDGVPVSVKKVILQ